MRRLGTPVPPPVQVTKSANVKVKTSPPSQDTETQGDEDYEDEVTDAPRERADSSSEDKGHGEYIEDIENFELIPTIRKEDGNRRKSSRQPKPKKFDESFESLSRDTKSRSSKGKEKESPATGKEGDHDDVDNTVRRSKRESKPKKLYIPEETPKEGQSKKSIKVEEEQEDVYIIESLVDVRDGKYLVKWENYPSSKNTWEPKSSIPKFILKFYEQDLSRLGMAAPDVS